VQLYIILFTLKFKSIPQLLLCCAAGGMFGPEASMMVFLETKGL